MDNESSRTGCECDGLSVSVSGCSECDSVVLGDSSVVTVKPSSGLHATSKKRGSQRVEWVDIGTVSRVAEIYKLSLGYLKSLIIG